MKTLIFCFLIPAIVSTSLARTGGKESTKSSIGKNEKASPVVEDSFGSYSFGHNLSTNARTLQDNQWSIGSLYLGYGINDNLTVGTSPFVMRTFQMANVMARYGFGISKYKRISFDFAYFKTYGGKVVTYQGECYFNEVTQEKKCYPSKAKVIGFVMEAFNLKATYSHQLNSRYRYNSTLSYFYYFDELMPFSFRMDPANSDPYTINLTSLHEFKLHENFFLNYEIGVWGFNYQYPYVHTGATLNFQKGLWMLGVGASTTFSPGFPAERARYFVGYDSRMSIHPEFEIQFFF